MSGLTNVHEIHICETCLYVIFPTCSKVSFFYYFTEGSSISMMKIKHNHEFSNKDKRVSWQLIIKSKWNKQGDKTKLYKCFKWGWPPTEDDLKILKVEYLRNQNLELIIRWPNQNINFFKIKMTSNGRQPQNYPKMNISVGTYAKTELYKCLKWRWPQHWYNLTQILLYLNKGDQMKIINASSWVELR
jgi:hypothetical protein